MTGKTQPFEDDSESVPLGDLLEYEPICKFREELNEKCIRCREATRRVSDQWSMNQEELRSSGDNPPAELKERLDAELNEKRDSAIAARRAYIKLLASGKYGDGPEFNKVIIEYAVKCNKAYTNREGKEVGCCFSVITRAYADIFDVKEMGSW